MNTSPLFVNSIARLEVISNLVSGHQPGIYLKLSLITDVSSKRKQSVLSITGRQAISSHVQKGNKEQFYRLVWMESVKD